MFQNVSHQREDSHSETSGETATSHDSGKGGSVEGDHSGTYNSLLFSQNSLRYFILRISFYVLDIFTNSHLNNIFEVWFI